MVEPPAVTVWISKKTIQLRSLNKRALLVSPKHHPPNLEATTVPERKKINLIQLFAIPGGVYWPCQIFDRISVGGLARPKSKWTAKMCSSATRSGTEERFFVRLRFDVVEQSRNNNRLLLIDKRNKLNWLFVVIWWLGGGVRWDVYRFWTVSADFCEAKPKTLL